MGKRFRNYFKRSYITSLKNIMLVYKAILAHGYSNFSLEILEYCEPDKIIILEREQYYLDLVFFIFPLPCTLTLQSGAKATKKRKPEYNILKTAGSSLGHKHSKETRDKIRAARLDRSEESLAKLREHLARLNSSQKQLEHLASRARS